MLEACQRPMTTSEIFKSTYQIMKENLYQLVMLNCVAFLPVVILFLLVALIFGAILFHNPLIFSRPAPERVVFIGAGIIAVILLILLSLIAMYYNVYGIFKTYEAAVQGRKISWRSSLKGAAIPVIYLIATVVPLNIVIGVICIILGFFNLVLPIFFIPQMLFLYGAQIFTIIALPAVALERKNPVDGVWMSCSLVWRNLGQALASYFLYMLIGICSGIIVSILSFIPLLIWLVDVGKDIFTKFDPAVFLNPWFIVSGLIFLIVGMLFGFALFNFYYGLQTLLFRDLKLRSQQ